MDQVRLTVAADPGMLAKLSQFVADNGIAVYDLETIRDVDLTEPPRVDSAHGIADSPTQCDLCHHEIHPGQHYLRLAVMLDTAALEHLNPFDVPEVVWSGIFDGPGCAVLELAWQIRNNPIFADVFAHR